MTSHFRARTFALLLLVIAVVGCQEHVTQREAGLSTVDPQWIVNRGGVQFVADSEVGLELAARQKRPCLLFFTAEWCTYCHQMEETAFVDPKIKQLAEQFVCVLRLSMPIASRPFVASTRCAAIRRFSFWLLGSVRLTRSPVMVESCTALEWPEPFSS